jgi:hypothetical protein
MKFQFAPLIAALATTVAFTTPAFAEERVCTGRIGAIALDNVFVPDGATCVLAQTRLNGNIVVGNNARLTARSVTMNGSVQADGAQAVTIEGRSMIGGSVQIVQGYAASITAATIGGTVLVDENSGPVSASRNRVTGDMQFFANRGGVTVIDNRINGNLQCKENSPPPTGYGNRAASKEDECAAL